MRQQMLQWQFGSQHRVWGLDQSSSGITSNTLCPRLAEQVRIRNLRRSEYGWQRMGTVFSSIAVRPFEHAGDAQHHLLSRRRPGMGCSQRCEEHAQSLFVNTRRYEGTSEGLRAWRRVKVASARSPHLRWLHGSRSVDANPCRAGARNCAKNEPSARSYSRYSHTQLAGNRLGLLAMALGSILHDNP